MKDSLPELPNDLPSQVVILQTALVNLINESFDKNNEIDKLSEQMKDLQISQKQTDERLNALTLLVEKLLNN